MKKENNNNRNYDPEKIELDPRFKIINNEAKITLIIWGLFASIVIGFSYYLGKGDPTNYNYIMGLPVWFFVACMLIFSFLIITYLVVKFKFKNFSLEDEIKTNKQEKLKEEDY